MRVLDLFSGAAGGWTLGLHRAGGFRTVAACELDPWRRAVYGRRWPDVKMYEDVRDLTAARLRDDGVTIDCVVGSPPCQDASIGRREKRTGTSGPRTGLFGEYLRLVRELRPRWTAAENVLGLVGVGADRIAAELDAAGYRVWVFNLGAEDFGATHERRRLWFVGMADADERGLENSRGEHGSAGKDRIGTLVGSREASGNPWRQGEGDAVRMADGFPANVASGRIVAAYGDSVVPQVVEAIGRAILQAEHGIRSPERVACRERIAVPPCPTAAGVQVRPRRAS